MPNGATTLASTLTLALACSAAAPGAPLRSPNLAPQHLLHLTPAVDAAEPLPRGASTAALDAAYASIFVDQGSPGEDEVRFDMEAARLALRLARGLGGGVEAGAEIPFAWLGSGWFDGSITAFHRGVGLPNGGRSDAGANEFTYDLRVGKERYAPSGGAGPADATVWVKAALPPQGPLRWAVRGVVKLPTGAPTRGLGSGYADASLGLLGSAEAGPLRVTGSADAVYVGGTADAALRLDTHWAAAASLSAGLGFGEASEVVVRLAYLSSPFGTGLSEVDRDVLQLVLGASTRVAGDVTLAVGFTEDLAVNSSPDFGLCLSVEAAVPGMP